MDCLTTRSLLGASPAPTEFSREIEAAHRHLRACAACRAWQDAGRDWRRALREGLPPVEAPLPVRERLFATLARARAGVDLRAQRRRLTAAMLVMGLASGSLAALFFWREATRDGSFVRSLAEDHLLYASNPVPAEFVSQDPIAVARWFAARVDFAVPPPDLRDGDLLGGRLCTLADRRVALWLWRSGDRRVSLFQMPAGGLALGRLRAMEVGSRRFLCGHHKGVGVLAWTERDLLYALVSDLPEEAMLRMVRS